MAAKSGVLGKVTLPDAMVGNASSALITKWTLNWAREILDISTFDSTIAETEHMGGLVDVTGTFEAFVAVGLPVPLLTNQQEVDAVGDTVGLCTFSLISTSKEYKFSAIVSGFTLSHAKSALVLMTATFDVSGKVGVTG